MKPQVAYRPITHVALYKESNNKATSPKWIRFSPVTTQRIKQDDFRDELNLDYYKNHQLIYSIAVAADDGVKKSKANWQTM